MKLTKKMVLFSSVCVMGVGLLTGCGIEDLKLAGNKVSAEEVKSKDGIEDLNLEGKGVYNGELENGLVEITMDGSLTPFQLTDEAKKQLASINGGDEVSFIYTDTQIEHRTIEKFLLK
ncbi:hypothetical protein [Bacillus sp. AK128]